MHNERGVKTYSVDIETVSQGKRAIDYTDGKTYKLGNVKDPVKVEAALQKKKDEERGKHGLSWITGKICSICFIDVFGNDEDKVFYGFDEEEILEKSAEFMDGSKLIGKSSEGFDFPFLVGRYMANGVRIPMSLKTKGLLYDVDKMFGWSSSSGQRGTLDGYAHGIGFKSKPMHGSQVQKLYDSILEAKMSKDKVAEDAGWKQLADYNVHDGKVVKALALAYYGKEGI